MPTLLSHMLNELSVVTPKLMTHALKYIAWNDHSCDENVAKNQPQANIKPNTLDLASAPLRTSSFPIGVLDVDVDRNLVLAASAEEATMALDVAIVVIVVRVDVDVLNATGSIWIASTRTDALLSV